MTPSPPVQDAGTTAAGGSPLGQGSGNRYGSDPGPAVGTLAGAGGPMVGTEKGYTSDSCPASATIPTPPDQEAGNAIQGGSVNSGWAEFVK